ncbi:MAG: SPOR domain-containing protein [Muribaculaceae bacterium]|nr:SPOR domain-containing protein [Muribaculaceae bacterium]
MNFEKQLKKISIQIFRSGFGRQRLAGILLLGGIVMTSVAQTENPLGEAETHFANPIDSIEYIANGNIEIVIDQNLLEDILEPPQRRKITTTHRAPAKKGTIGKIKGYRIQVFSDGRDQRSLEARAKQRGSAIAAKFPKYRGQVYTYSSAPNWITRVGNFRTSSEAQAALSELKSAFPRFAGEMRVVNTQIYVLQ